LIVFHENFKSRKGGSHSIPFALIDLKRALKGEVSTPYKLYILDRLFTEDVDSVAGPAQESTHEFK
jgi:hypothetical protein